MSHDRPVSLSFMRTFAPCFALVLALLPARPADAQSQGPASQMQFPQPVSPHLGGGLDDRGDTDPVDAARRFRALNDMRQKAIVSDTNKLLKLAGEFDEEVRKTNSDSLTPDQLHRLATIEKLARSVKEKMSTPVAGTPSSAQPPTLILH